jgi:hypothetical protein
LRNIKRESLKAKINELTTDNKNGSIRYLYTGIIDFEKGYQPGTNIIKDENVGLVTEFHRILARWRNDLSAAECTWGSWC